MKREMSGTAEMKKHILNQFRESGCRITKQREVLVDVILREKCNNCKEIYYLAAKEDPSIGMATVYRMMNTLEEIGALKWRNEYKICDQRKADAKRCHVEFEDSSSMELKEEVLRAILERGLDVSGHLKGRKVKRVIMKEES